jgi:hypothetical protein
MTGRIEEQAYLKAAIADPEQDGVLVAGGAGVGKTRLLREVTEGHYRCYTGDPEVLGCPLQNHTHWASVTPSMRPSCPPASTRSHRVGEPISPTDD